MNTNIMGIYKITNKVNGKFYIGSSVNIMQRWRQHKYELDNNRHINQYLQNAWNKYGSENFEFEIIEKVENKDALLDIEQSWLDETQCYNPNIGYNLSMCTKGVYIDFTSQRERLVIKDLREIETKLYYKRNENIYDINGKLISTMNNLNGLIISLHKFYNSIIHNDEHYLISSILSNCILYSKELNFNMLNIVESKTDINNFIKDYSIEMIRIENYCHSSEYINIYKDSFVIYKINENRLRLHSHYRMDEIKLYSNI